MNYQGNKIDKLHEDLTAFMEHTEYCIEDFRNVTFLYAKEAEDKKKNTIQFDPIRPCDQDEYLGLRAKIDHTPIRLGFFQIPDEIREKIDPEEASCANLAFMFDEGDDDNERIYFVDEIATHTMHRLPIINTSSLTHNKIQLLAENLMMLDDPRSDSNEDGQEEDGKKIQATCMPKMTLRIDNKGFKHVVGFRSMNNASIALDDYIDNFLKVAGNDIITYQADDKNWFVVVKANKAKAGVSKHPWEKHCPCYALRISDSGQGAPTFSTGWIDEDGNGIYAQSDLHVLQATNIADLITELQETMDQFKKIHKEHVKEIKRLNKNKLVLNDPSKKITIVSSIISSIPQYQKALGTKGYSALVNKETEKYAGRMSEFELRSKMFEFAVDNATADFAKKVLSESVGAMIIGIVPTPAQASVG